jgi:hypothetical protein
VHYHDVVGQPATVAVDPLAAFGFVFQVFFALGCAWLIVGNRYFFEGESMERPANRIAQLYGYAVCLIAIVIFIVTVRGVAAALITMSDPLEAQTPYAQSLTSFEAYKASLEQPNMPYAVGTNAQARPGASDAQLRQRYEDLRAERLASTLYQAKTDLTLNGLLLVISIILFVVHWRWLRTLGRA